MDAVTIELRPVEKSQTGDFLKLVEDIWIPTFRPIIDSPRLERLFQGMYSTEKVNDLIDDPDYWLYYILSNGNPVGYLGLRFEPQSMQLDKIYIHPHHQGKGYGYATLKKVIDLAEKKNRSRIWLRVNRGNRQAIEFYQRNGFVIEESVDYPAGDGFVYDDYVMGNTMNAD